jgi:hypothetical protein
MLHALWLARNNNSPATGEETKSVASLAGLGSAASADGLLQPPTFSLGHAKSDNRGEANGRCTAAYRGECESVNGKS